MHDNWCPEALFNSNLSDVSMLLCFIKSQFIRVKSLPVSTKDSIIGQSEAVILAETTMS